jgi:RimJ/RimL family protein N-acetyltransferase
VSSPLWPPHGLVLTTPTVVLRGMTEADAQALAAVVPDDLELDPRLPDLSPAQKCLRVYWQQVGSWQADDWVLPFTVVLDGRPVGLQALEGKDFPVLRTVDSHSWLVPEVRGQGHGKAMRAAVLELAFAHLGAQVAVTEAWDDNAASLGVSRALGYVDDGEHRHLRDGRAGRMLRMRLTSWSSPVPVGVSGLPPCLPLLGL